MTGTWPLGWQTGDVEIAAQYGKGWGSIFDSTLGGSAATIDITSIVATYAHLLVVVYARGDTALVNTNIVVRFNGDAGANYDYQQLQGSAATVASGEIFAATVAIAGVMPANGASANLFNSGLIFIPHYAGSSNNKVALSLSSSKGGTSTTNMAVNLAAGFWRSSAAINRVTLIPNAGNFVAGTRATIYAMGA